MDATHPYGAWTRPYYLGRALAQTNDVFQVGFDCSDVTYGPSISVHTKTIPAYIRAIRQAKAEFEPDIVYAHETFPGVAAWLSSKLKPDSDDSHLVLDFHAASAHEYKTMFNHYDSRIRALLLFTKSYWPQRFIAVRGGPIITASQELKSLVSDWYHVSEKWIHVVPNGAPLEFLDQEMYPSSPYPEGIRTALAVAPNNMMANVLSVRFILQVAEALVHLSTDSRLKLVVAGGGWQKDQIENYPNIVYLGFVDDLLPYIDHADVCLLPFPRVAVCGGARNKALDYFARGKLVLSTVEGLRGLSCFKHSEQVLISSDDPMEFSRDLLTVANCRESYDHLGENACTLVRGKYTWQHSAAKVLSFFTQLLENESVVHDR